MTTFQPSRSGRILQNLINRISRSRNSRKGKPSHADPHAIDHERRAKKLIAQGDADAAAIHRLLAVNMKKETPLARR